MTKLMLCVELVVCLTSLFAVSTAAKIDTSGVGLVKDAPSIVSDKIKATPNVLSSTPPTTETPDLSDSGALWSIARKDDAVKVGVHVPVVFDLTKHEADKISKLDLSIFGGMFSLNKNKSKQPNGSMSGPTSISLFGIPIYSKTSVNPTVLEKINRFIRDSQIIHPLTKLSEKIDPETSRKLLNNINQKNQKVMSSVFENLVRFTSHLSNQLQLTNVNGDPVSDASKYVLISNITEFDLVPKSPIKM